MEIASLSTGQTVIVHTGVSMSQSVTVHTGVKTGQSVTLHTTLLHIDNLKGPAISASLQKGQESRHPQPYLL